MVLHLTTESLEKLLSMGILIPIILFILIITMEEILRTLQPSFAIDSIGQVWAWGDNQVGQIGNGIANTTVISTPVQAGSAALNGVDIVKLSVSGNSSEQSVVAIDQSGKVYSWGYNAQGQLGIGNRTSPITTPTLSNITSGAVDVITSNNTTNGFTTVLKNDGTIWTTVTM